MSSPEIVIRELLIGDYAAAVGLWEKVEGVEVAEGDLEHEIVAYLQRNPGLSRIAFDGEQIVGAVLCGHDGRRGWIYHLAVAPPYRGHGLGKRLIDECLAGLRAAGIRRAIILVARDNPPGRSFWRNQHWEELSEAVPMARDV
jgi:ribosomal protein S18 acetylase RimI-like enzyme